MQNSDAMALTAALLAAAGGLTQRINEGVVARGFEGVRPA
ncbi:MarR family transcriptional regulator, partial [Streptomyces anthocyanicus]